MAGLVVDVEWRARVTQGEDDLTRLVRSRIRTAFRNAPFEMLKVVVLAICPNGKAHAIVRKASVDTEEGVSMNIWVQGGQGVDCIVTTEAAKLPLLLKFAQSLDVRQKKAQRALENKKKPKKPKAPKPVDNTLRLRRGNHARQKAPRKGITVITKKVVLPKVSYPLDRLSMIESTGLSRPRPTLTLRSISAT